jgi:hypothetical protein
MAKNVTRVCGDFVSGRVFEKMHVSQRQRKDAIFGMDLTLRMCFSYLKFITHGLKVILLQHKKPLKTIKFSIPPKPDCNVKRQRNTCHYQCNLIFKMMRRVFKQLIDWSKLWMTQGSW